MRKLIERVNALNAVRFEYHKVTRRVRDRDYRLEWMSKLVIFSYKRQEISTRNFVRHRCNER